MVMDGHPWSLMVINGHQWSSMGINGHQWASMVINGHHWSSMVINGQLSSIIINQKGDSDKNGILYFNLWVFCGFLTTKHHPKCYLLIECSQNQVQKH